MKSIFKLLIVVLIFGLGVWYWLSKPDPPVMVGSKQVTPQELLVTISATTTSIVKSNRAITVSSQRSTKVTYFKKKEGDQIEMGEVVVRLDNEELEAKKKQTRAILETARARLRQAEAAIELDRKTISSGIEEAKISLENSKKDLNRIKTLAEGGAASQSKFDETQKFYDLAKEKLNAAKARSSQNKVRTAEMEAAKANIKEIQASFELVDVQLGYGIIRSPFGGVISSKQAEKDEFVTIGQSLFTLIDLLDIYVESTIDEVDVGRCKVGQPVSVTFDAFPGKEIEGKIIKIYPIVTGAKQETRTFIVKVGVSETKLNLKPGLSADIAVETERKQNTLAVPSQAVMVRDGKSFVYIIKENTAILTEIQTGLDNWQQIEILEGVSENDWIITSPDTKGLKDGVSVTKSNVPSN